MRVYVISENYLFEGIMENNIIAFADKKQAKEYFDNIVKKECETSWINNLGKADMEEIDREETYFYAFDSNNYDETYIYIKEFEI